MTASKQAEKRAIDDRIFHVEGWVSFCADLVFNNQDLWIKLGNLESKFLEYNLKKTRIKKPIYVSGLARSGSTLLLEILDNCPGVTSHQYKDFPFIYTPFWWNWLLAWMQSKNTKPIERAHRDGVLITPDSPEAMEEIVWMTFFKNLHNPKVSNILDRRTSRLKFEHFYTNHIRKLLLARRGDRYLAKGNYNITRLEYILKIFPDARFIIPIRHPVSHIASLMKQHRLFCRGQQENPQALKHLQRVGHFEFGLDLRPINLGDTQKVEEIAMLWKSQNDVCAWSRYWNQIYDYIAQQLKANSHLREAVTIVRFEDLCQSPEKTIRAIMEHCSLENSEQIIQKFSHKIKSPSYYQADFLPDELKIIEQETQSAASQFGYS
jgi:Sulfotransferase family